MALVMLLIGGAWFNNEERRRRHRKGVKRNGVQATKKGPTKIEIKKNKRAQFALPPEKNTFIGLPYAGLEHLGN